MPIEQTIEQLATELTNLKIEVNNLRRELASVQASTIASSHKLSVGSRVYIVNPSKDSEKALGQIWKISKRYPYYHHIIFPDNSKARRIAKNLRASP